MNTTLRPDRSGNVTAQHGNPDHGRPPRTHRPQAGTTIRWPRATPPRIPSRGRRHVAFLAGQPEKRRSETTWTKLEQHSGLRRRRGRDRRLPVHREEVLAYQQQLTRCQQRSGGGGSNARSGPAAGGSSGTVSSLSTSGFTITTRKLRWPPTRGASSTVLWSWATASTRSTTSASTGRTTSSSTRTSRSSAPTTKTDYARFPAAAHHRAAFWLSPPRDTGPITYRYG